MEKYRFNEVELALIEGSCIPLAIYQFINKRVVTVAISEGFCRLFGFTREEAYRLMDEDMYRDTHPDDVSRIADAAFRFAVDEEPYNVVYRSKIDDVYRIIHSRGEHVYTKNGVRLAVVWYTDEGTYVPDALEFESDLNRGLNFLLHDESMNQANYYDRLTGLPNMNYFFELARAGRQQLLAEGKEMALIFFDLNGMKYFNGKYGFAEGDKLLRSVARILVKHYSNENCGYLGQDHFAVYTSAEDVEDTLRKVFASCEQANDGNSLPVRAGIYLDQLGSVDIGIACDRAKAACDLGRASYRSEYRFFNEDMLTSAENRQYIVRNIDRAIREGWIEVYYQPIVRTTNGRVCDEEALARWIDPERGFLSPADFIPILEDARLIYKLDLYVLEKMLRKMRRFDRAGMFLVPASINLSRFDFDSCDIVEEVCRRVDAAGISHSMVSIEITESVIASDLEFMKEQIERFQALGFPVWMDDFGSGYSSLDVLQSIHFDLIKFDMMFMRQFDEGDKSKIILTELVKMAVGLGVDTIAEGVERPEQVSFLREIGCSKLQGFYYCKPIPEDRVMERYRRGTQIGFENPEESDYFAALGRANLYDLSIIAHDERESLRHYFDTIPMAIVEAWDDGFRIVRCNRTYREFIANTFDAGAHDEAWGSSFANDAFGPVFQDAMRRCATDGNRVFVDEKTYGGEMVHAIIRRIAVNPVTGAAALAVAVLAVTSDG